MSMADEKTAPTQVIVRPLRWRTHLTQPAEPGGRIEWAVEVLIERAGDYCDDDLVRALVTVRPELSERQIRSRVDELRDLAGDIATANTSSDLQDSVAAYRVALHEFVAGVA